MNSESENGFSANNPAPEPLHQELPKAEPLHQELPKADPLDQELPNAESPESGLPGPITGDVIGNTAYSERFVLKILLKLANRDILQQIVKEPSFEEELCTLWDMTAERDVVLYLKTHDALNLFTFAIPVIDSSRINEIIIGTIANMCCHREIVNVLMANKDWLVLLLQFLKLDDVHILIQVLRLVRFCLYEAEEEVVSTWLSLFERFQYAELIFFTLNNSSNKELLMIAMENLHTVCSTCHTDRCEMEFVELFINTDAPKAMYVAHSEYSKLASPDEKLERLHIIALQIVLHLSALTITTEPPSYQSVSSKRSAVNLLRDILVSYVSRIDEYHKMDHDFIDVLDAVTAFIQYLEGSGVRTCPEKYFGPSYYMWKALLVPRESDGENIEVVQFTNDIKESFGLIMCNYMAHCTDEDLIKVLVSVGDDYESIVSQGADVQLQDVIKHRVLMYRNRINGNVD